VKCMNAFGFAALFVFPLAGYSTGCSGTGSTGTGTGGNTASSSGGGSTITPAGSSGGAASGSGGGSSSGMTGPTDSTCAGLQTNSECQQCCAQVHASGYQTFATALLTCACSTTGGCGQACAASACAQSPMSPMSGDACDTCIGGDVLSPPDGGAAPCDKPIVTACAADPNCGQFAQCAKPCVSKS
jgi:hypothetical protein